MVHASFIVSIYYKTDPMTRTRKKEIIPFHRRRLEIIATMLREMRFVEGKRQDQYIDLGLTRRQIQRGEHVCNLSLVQLFHLLDCHGYSLGQFFEDME
jgi:hypothetical protein